MPRLSNLEEIARLYAERGGRRYGEGVTQLDHALQCAALAEESGAPPSLIAAALIHDVGHFFVGEDLDIDDHHETVGSRALESLFDDAITAPIALHVSAKRYLCFAEPGYFAGLSAASKASLALQGGPFAAAEAQDFERRPFWQDALTLRRFDDMGKRPEPAAKRFCDYLPILRGLLQAK